MSTRARLRRTAAATAAIWATLAAAGGPAPALARTTACPGSLNGNGSARNDKKGLISDYYIRDGSCAAARKLVQALDDIDEAGKPGRKGSLIGIVRVPGGSIWKCRATVTADGMRRPFDKIDPNKTMVVRGSLSCRPITGRLGRRVTARTRNIRDQLLDESG